MDNVNKVKSEILDRLIKKLESKEPPEIIYHYTNDAGLKGILETGQLRLTDIFHLNDPSEVEYGMSHAIKILNSKAESDPPESREFAKKFESALQGNTDKIAHFFVLSFSSEGDDLGQWRAYADNGRGYALGFDAKVLEDAFKKEVGIPSTFRVTYKKAKIKDIHRQLIESMFDRISPPHGNNSEDAILKELAKQAIIAALLFKHKAYKNEKEYRFLQTHGIDQQPEVELRYRSYELIKYREFDWRCLQAGALKKIVIGPAADRSKATQFAEDCLAAFHVEDVEISDSKIPYRAT